MGGDGRFSLRASAVRWTVALLGVKPGHGWARGEEEEAGEGIWAQVLVHQQWDDHGFPKGGRRSAKNVVVDGRNDHQSKRNYICIVNLH